MLISLRKSGSYGVTRYYRRLDGACCNRQQTARCARGAVGGIVGVVRARASGLDVRPRVRAELPLHQRRERQQQLSGDEETGRRPSERRWKSADAAIARHKG